MQLILCCRQLYFKLEKKTLKSANLHEAAFFNFVERQYFCQDCQIWRTYHKPQTSYTAIK